MRRPLARKLRRVAILGCLLLWPLQAQAQGIGGSDFDRVLRPGAAPFHDAAPFSHRYHYYTGPIFYPGLDGQRLWNLYHLDREERAERFGYSTVPGSSPSRGLFSRFRRQP